jgi:small conductance mechanosensitive channel
MPETSSEVIDGIVMIVTTYGLKVIGAIAILIVGWMAAGWARRIVIKTLSRSERVDKMLHGFFGSLVKYLILAVTVIAVLNQFGVQTASLIAVLGAAGLAIGLALQGTLSNVAAGVMLLIFRPFKIDDYVDIAGLAGTVKSVGLFVTELATPDNVQIIVPNSQVWGAAIYNYSFHNKRRVDLLVGVAYEDDAQKAMEVLLQEASTDARVEKDPAPFIAVAELADSSVNLTLRVWCDNADYWPLKFDLTKAVKRRLDAEGISIPYPQRQVHMAPSPSKAA